MIRAKSYTKNRWNICRSCGGTRSFFLSRVWDKEKYNSESSRGIKRQTFGIRAPMLYHWATETMMSNGFTRCIWHTRPAYSYNKQSEQNQTEIRWRQDGKVVRSTALTYDWPLSCPAKTAAEWGTRRHFLFFRQAWRKCERRGLRKKKSAKKMYKKGKNIVVDLPPTQIQSVGVDCSLLAMAFQAFS